MLTIEDIWLTLEDTGDIEDTVVTEDELIDIEELLIDT